MVVYSILLVDLSSAFYYLPKPLLVYGSLLLSTLILSSYSVIVVMLEYYIASVFAFLVFFSLTS